MLEVVEIQTFIRQADKIFTDEELDNLRVYLAYNPDAGVVIKGTRGIRKLRWQASNRGKRGGARVIYFYYNDATPVYLLSAYAKKVREDITADEKKVLQQLVDGIRKD
ncbi:type II toxin-antitoxin system RelE/ParE family toxin [Adonisia turfae]|uniref:Addiction module toxin RelE n=1 Tax=Adonisia turfae CCMR0081 TaxID=2292702 RepID=A0A6M0RXT0_9CYAN|nr:type II toxin-antitoxin system RelE/ParE family toxin [Adonisia turfae]NEZ61038.1 addiction module toxin RelE [Adonisia turfae CCMR0081]